MLISFLFFSPSNSCSLVVGCWGKTSAAVGDSECVTGGMVSEPCTSEGCSNPQLITAGGKLGWMLDRWRPSAVGITAGGWYKEVFFGFNFLNIRVDHDASLP